MNERVKQLTADLEKTKAQEATALARIKELEEANQILTRNLQRDKEAFNYSQRSITSKDRIPTAKNGTKSDIPAPTINMISDEVYSAIYSKDDILPYTNAIDKLLEESRKQRGPSPNILIAMKAVVIACKSITQVCENFENEQELPYPDAQDIEDSKLQLSESLTTLMAIVKDLSVKDPDSSSVERIYNAACDLTSVVINLVKTINSIAEQEDEEPNQPPSTQSRNTLRYSIPELKVFQCN